MRILKILRIIWVIIAFIDIGIAIGLLVYIIVTQF